MAAFEVVLYVGRELLLRVQTHYFAGSDPFNENFFVNFFEKLTEITQDV
jgi:hypothetical protein